MSQDEMKKSVRRYIEDVWGKADYQAERELLSPNYVDHNPGPGMQAGLAGHHAGLEAFHKGFSNLEFNVELLVAEGDKVVDHWTGYATQTGEFMGMPPTGKELKMSGTDILRFKDGKILEAWHVEEMGSIEDMASWSPQPAMASPSKN